MIEVGRVWGMSVSSAPRVTTMSAPKDSATSTIRPQKVRHRSWGSVPVRMTTSWLVPGTVPA